MPGATNWPTSLDNFDSDHDATPDDPMGPFVDDMAAAVNAMQTNPGAEVVNAVTTSGTAVTLPSPLSQPTSHVILTANCTITLPTPTAGTTILLAVKENATGGWTRAWAVTGGSSIAWANGNVEPTPTTTANKTDLYTFTSFLGSTWLGADGGRNF